MRYVSRLVVAIAVASGAVACASAPSASAPRASGTNASSPQPTAGDAARILCEGECRRSVRCGSETAAQCFPRCATLPVRSPPVWRADWANEIAACFDRIDCAHDRDERCIVHTSFHTHAAATCLASAGGGGKVAAFCQVLNGLTKDADDAANDCLRGGGGVRSCSPAYDWK